MQGNILDDEVLINTLAESKVTSDEIKIKVAESEKTEVAIDETREVRMPKLHNPPQIEVHWIWWYLAFNQLYLVLVTTLATLLNTNLQFLEN